MALFSIWGFKTSDGVKREGFFRRAQAEKFALKNLSNADGSQRFHLEDRNKAVTVEIICTAVEMDDDEAKARGFIRVKDELAARKSGVQSFTGKLKETKDKNGAITARELMTAPKV